MEKKTIYYILGGVAVLGIGYYLWNNSQKKAKETEVTEEKEVTNEKTIEEVKEVKPQIKDLAGKIQNVNLGAIKLNAVKDELSKPRKFDQAELDKKLAECGKKPLLKKNKKSWEECRNKKILSMNATLNFEGVSEMYDQNMIREKSFAEQVINREDGRMFAGSVYDN